MFEHWIRSDLKKLPAVETLAGRAFSGDSGANKIGVVVTDGGEAVTLTGTVKAYIVRPNGTTIEATGDKSGNTAWVVLPEGAYAYAGKIGVFLKLINGTVVTTLGGVEAYVYKSL